MLGSFHSIACTSKLPSESPELKPGQKFRHPEALILDSLNRDLPLFSFRFAMTSETLAF